MEGFPRSHRLLKPEQFGAVFSARQVVRGSVFALHYRPNGAGGARLGLVMAKKQARRAVLRNALKRQVREAFRHCRVRLPGVDIVVRLAQPVTVFDKPNREKWRQDAIGLFEQLIKREEKRMEGPV